MKSQSDNRFGTGGAGLALAFKKRYPANSAAYRAECKYGRLMVGKVFVFDNGVDTKGPRYIINVPTKEDWRNPSKLEYVTKGLRALHTALRDRHISTVGIPMLGAGLGGLDPDDVLNAFIDEFRADRDITATLYLHR